MIANRPLSLTAAVLTAALAAPPVQAAASFRSDFGLSYADGELCLASGGYSPPEDYTPPPTGTPAPPVADPPTVTPPPTGGPIESPGFAGSDCVDDFDGFEVSGQVFLGEVDPGRGPYRLAPFLARASSVGGSYGRFETDASGVDVDRWSLFARLVTDRGWVFEGAYETSEFDGTGFDTDLDEYRVAGGYYLAQDTQLRLSYSNDDADFADSERWAIDVTHVQQLENGMTWSLHALYGFVTGDAGPFDDDGNDILLSGQWFFRDDIGVGVDFELIDRDATGDLFAWEIFGNWFVTEKVSLNLSYRAEDFDDLDADTKALEFEARYRF